MNRQVFLLFGDEEAFLGTVEEVIGCTNVGDDKGCGIAVQAVIAEIVDEMAFGVEDCDRIVLTIELREPGSEHRGV